MLGAAAFASVEGGGHQLQEASGDRIASCRVIASHRVVFYRGAVLKTPRSGLTLKLVITTAEVKLASWDLTRILAWTTKAGHKEGNGTGLKI